MSKQEKYIVAIGNLVSEGLIDTDTARKLERMTPAYEVIELLIDMLAFDANTVKTFVNRLIK